MSQTRNKRRRYENAVRRQIVLTRLRETGDYPCAPAAPAGFVRAGDRAEQFAPLTTVYFAHDILTPENVRAKWDDVTEVPKVGDPVTLDAGYCGARVEWRVVRQEWLNPQAVVLHMTGPTGEALAAM